MMNKIDPVSTTFAIAAAKKEAKKVENKIFDILEEVKTIQGPKGDKGDRGERGQAGLHGMIGPQGEIGPVGPKGDKGDKGETGERGEIGPQGDKGDKGDVGPQGPKGDKGDRGEQGIQGEQGPRGEKGEIGPQGLKGDKGDQGIQGEKGEKGDTGSAGPRGEKGEQGEQGPKGEQGEQGPKGDDGQSVNEEEVKLFLQKLVESAKEEIENKHDEYVIISSGSNEESLSQFKDQLRKDIDVILEKHRKIIDMKVAQSGWGSTSSGGGSTQILDNDDVVFKQIATVLSDSILIFDPVSKKFKTEVITDALDRLGYETGGGGPGNIVAGTGIDVDATANSATISLEDTSVTPGTYGNSLTVPRITVDQQGRLTNVEEVQITSSGGDTGGDIKQLTDISFAGNTATILYEDYQIESIVSYIVKDATTSKVVSLDTTVGANSISFESFVDLSNFLIDISYIKTITISVVSDAFNLSGLSYTLDLIANSIGDIVNYYITNPNDKIIDADIELTGNNIIVESNIDLTGHTLTVIHNLAQ